MVNTAQQNTIETSIPSEMKAELCATSRNAS